MVARSKQLLPAGDWRVWLILAGRGWGKTRTGAEAVREWKAKYPRIGIIAPTAADGRDVCIEGPSGLKTICRTDEIAKWNRSLGELEFDTGARVKLFSSEEPDRLRGPQHFKLWCDEAGVWKYPTDTWDMAMLGLRLGDNPQAVVTTTPKPIELIRKLMASTTTILTRGSTYENAGNLAQTFFEQTISLYEGTRLGRQEIEAEMLDDVPGALWQRAWLDASRIERGQAPNLVRIVVAIDPAITSGETSAETGIIVAGKGEDGRGYVLDDLSRRDTPGGWAMAAVKAYDEYEADCIVAEVNQGGDMVENTIRTVRDEDDKPIGENIYVRQVHAMRGKATRAEPVSALYQQGRVSHAGTFPTLEDQLCNWLPGETSPDRLDALVWAMSDLNISQVGAPAGATAKASPKAPSRFVRDNTLSGGRWHRR